ASGLSCAAWSGSCGRTPAPRGLCSFPTRRSSDLGVIAHRAAAALGHAEGGEARLAGALFCEERVVDDVRPRIAALHIIDADLFEDRKSTRLNSSHVKTSYAVSCVKKKRRRPPVSG